ncbi:MAG: glycosyltransferase family 9 protein [Pirellulaceae bacterium]
MAELVQNPKRVLITRLSAIGDCLLTIPLAVRAKELWPDCTITWLVDCAAHQFLSEHPAVDEVIRIDKGWLKNPAGWKVLRRKLQRREFDVALDPQGLTKSSVLAWLSGAPCRVGFDRSHARELAPLLATHRVRRTQTHMVDSYLQVLEPWSSTPAGVGRFDMPTYSQASIAAETILRRLRLNDSTWLTLNPGAGWTTRIWPSSRFGALAREFYRERGIRSLILWAGESERLMAEVIAEAAGGAAIVAPATTLTEMLELIRRSAVLITGDTGPLHVASSVNTPCVSLHGVTWSDESGPYGNPSRSIQSPLTPPSGKLVRKGANTAMQAIETDEVLQACYELLDASCSIHHGELRRAA